MRGGCINNESEEICGGYPSDSPKYVTSLQLAVFYIVTVLEV